MAGSALLLLAMQIAGAAAFSPPCALMLSHHLRAPLTADAMRLTMLPRVAPLRPRVHEASKMKAQIEFSDWDGEDLVKMQRVDPLDEAGYRMHESSDNFVPLALHAVTHLTEGDIVEYVLEGFKQVNMGMVVEDSTDGEVKVRKLLRRDGDGEFDEWRCVVAKTEAVVEVPVYAVRYVGTCTECSEENGVC
ncbi:hypothetical protein GUITHDRAFT_148703 [Guillardia theta CCMP2712]|uniref:Uncharacterized protein n=1 Tax=Guillardia theta (strain CCMP2712) TaxID=905079 RepID=L1I8E7_GUITC|nr:hypothetical protein GUITHDRAFT_148703 [Guillardia theta CCMP2712]EKX32337.1 hypothetical protein GUITHDRAFT_148703 [Guillardia theta CCMP2712]|eukprot:XP_005819317.1 hypothetical protein GUITHDRAFT_148703 [Guillardia theta CCMP2712]